MAPKTRLLLATIGSIFLLLPNPANADQPNQTAQSPASTPPPAALFGSWDGPKPWLRRRGVTLGVTGQVAGSNVLAGGGRQGNAFASLLTPSARIELARYTGIPHLAAYVSAWLVQGHGPTAYYVHSLSGISYIEAPDGARLADAYLTWKAPHDAIHVKIGKMGIDENFDQNPAGAALLNSNFTYRNIMADNLPGGGPAFSYESPGVMVAVQATRPLRLRIGLYSGDGLGLPLQGALPPARDAGGLAFPLDTGALLIAEADYAYLMPGFGKGTLRLGGLYDTLSRADLAFSVTGQSLALPTAGPARQDHGEYVLYAGDSQTLWRGPGKHRLRGFARIADAPPAQNLIIFDAQAGMVLTAPFADRLNDSAALAIGYDRISGQKIAFTRAENAISASALPIPSAETDIELDYNAQITRWLTATPDLQYIAHPGGGIADPNNSPKREPSAVIAQVQLAITF